MAGKIAALMPAMKRVFFKQHKNPTGRNDEKLRQSKKEKKQEEIAALAAIGKKRKEKLSMRSTVHVFFTKN